MRKIAKRAATITGPTLLAAACLAVAAPKPATAAAFPAELELSTLNGANGFTIDGTSEFEGTGLSVAAAGDINGDGFDDIVVGGGYTYVLFGTNQGFPVDLPVSALDGTNGFIITRQTAGGFVVSGAGDVNGDGIDDIVFGGVGWSYVLFGSANGFPAVFDLSMLDGSNGFAVNLFEYSVAGAGDVNGDGFADIVIGEDSYGWDIAPDFDLLGRAVILFGTNQGFPALVDIATLDGSNGFTFEGIDGFGQIAFSVSGVGDFNGDGFDDILIGSPAIAFKPSGDAFMLFGTDQGFPAVMRVSDLDGSNGFAMFGAGDGSDYYVSAAGDLNGDGLGDVILGAPYIPGPAGEFAVGRSYVLFGSRAVFPAPLDLESLDGTSGFAINGSDPAGHSGFAVSGAGDIDGDGFDDVIVGSPLADPGGRVDAGQGHVVFGSDQGFPARIELGSLDGKFGFAINGITAQAYAGYAVSGAGDLNGDGIDDFLIGAPFTTSDSGAPQAGKAHVVFGRPTPGLTIAGACPGSVTIGVTGATPGGAVALLHAAAEGSYTVPSGACTGTILDLASPALYTTLTADATGAAALTQTLPAAACGRFLQTVDATTCAPSNTASLP